MARGDFIEVVYRTGAGTASHRIKARNVGATVEHTEPKSTGLFVTVEETNKGGEVVNSALFAKGEVVAIIRGHEDKAKAKIVQKTKQPINLGQTTSVGPA
jgi:hypothetical protein